MGRLPKRHCEKKKERLFFLRTLKKFGVSIVSKVKFYRAVIESVLTSSLTVWFGSSTVQQRSQICNIIQAASKMIGCDLPTIDDIYVSRLQKKVYQSWKTPYIQPNTSLHLFLQADALEQFRLSTCLLNSTYCRIVHALNSSGIYASAFLCL